MATQIGTTTAITGGAGPGAPFYGSNIANDLIRLSDNALVAFYIKDGDDLHYAISTDDGSNWSEYLLNAGDYGSVTALKDGDDVDLLLCRDIQSTTRAVRLTYNSGSSTFSAGSFVNASNTIRGGSWYPNLLRFNSQLHLFGGYYVTYSILNGYTDSVASAWTNNNHSLGSADAQSVVAINMSDSVRVFYIYQDDVRYHDLTYSGSYTWSAETNLFTAEAIDTTSGLWMTAHYISDSEMYIAWRDGSNQWKYSYYDGTWSSSADITGATYTAIPQFISVSGSVLVGYKKYNSGSAVYESIVYREMDGSTIGDEVELLSASTSIGGVSFEKESTGEINFCYTDGASSPYGIYYESVVYTGGKSIFSATETLNVSDSSTLTPQVPWLSEVGTTINPSCAYFGEAVNTFANLTHLNGEVVSIVANGEVLDEQTVVSGTINLSQYYSIIHVGLPYYSDLETLKINVPLKGDQTRTSKIKIGNVTFFIKDSQGGSIGPDEDNTYEAFSAGQIIESSGIDMDDYDLFTGKVRFPLGSEYGDGGKVFIRQTKPLPITVGAIMPEVDIGGYSR